MILCFDQKIPGSWMFKLMEQDNTTERKLR